MGELLADENIPYKAVQASRQIGLDILSVVELATGADDERIVEMARDQGRILVTLEEEIGQYAARHPQECPGVIQLRVWPRGPRWFADRMRRLLDSARTLEGMHTVLYEDRVRQFPLPGWQHEAEDQEPPAEQDTEPKTEEDTPPDAQDEPPPHEQDADRQAEEDQPSEQPHTDDDPAGEEEQTGDAAAEPTD